MNPWRSLTVHCPKRLSDQFRKTARESFPNEAYAFLLGSRAGEAFDIQEIWYPPQEEATPFEFPIHPRIVLAASHRAAENGWTILGDIHSHTYDFESFHGVKINRVLSELDLTFWESLDVVRGIVNVDELSDGRLTTTAPKFFGRQDMVVSTE